MVCEQCHHHIAKRGSPLCHPCELEQQREEAFHDALTTIRAWHPVDAAVGDQMYAIANALELIWERVR